ncbi:uncharacterized protein [Henckelia pumila]|uniref:uncharacterized protein n=1 Tax=Henckelia pumila TaxID=405737 RepID=UPI003C6E474B
MQFPPQNVQNFPGFGNFMSHPNYTSRGPPQPLPAEYWQNTSHPPFTPPVLQVFGTPYTTGTHFSSSMPTEPASPTFVPETQLSDRESPIEVEDEVLARSFVTISDDPIIGNDQKADAFWGRVASYYNDNRPAGSNNRKANVIRSHWHNTIQKKVNLFNANYNSIYSLYRSGHSDEDILRFAYEKYREEHNGVAFNLEHVWRIVKDRPMFTPQSDDHFVATKKTRTSESGASNTSSNQNVSVDIDDEDNRPMGRKAAKIKGKDKHTVSRLFAWKGQFTRGHGSPTIVLEAVASHDLWIWHAFFGVSGSRNDINVLYESPIFNNVLQGNAPEDPKRKLFMERQESARKDVEQAFGVLQSRWAIVRGPARYWYRKKLKQIMLACIILHNMIIEDEGGHVIDWYNDEADELAQPILGSNRGFQDYLRKNLELRDTQVHHQLRADLVEHIWGNYNNMNP